mgnify:FL=1
MKKINSLIKDIYNLFKDNKGCKLKTKDRDAIIDVCVENIRDQLTSSIMGNDRDASRLRMSNVGYPDRKIWYQCNNTQQEELQDNDPIKFLYGHIIEELVFCFAKLSGHKVTDQQKETTLEGIKGHIDGRIDGVLVDVKSASPISYRKFKDRTLYSDDPFGYIDQLSSYATALKDKEAGFLVMNKISGELCWMGLDELEIADTSNRIKFLKGMVTSTTPPPKCYPDVPEGKSGNYKLSINCFYCSYKKECWADANNGHGLRTFMYKKGPVHLTRVSRVPDVPEVGI